MKPMLTTGHAIATAYELELHKVPATLQTELDAERLRVWAYLVLSDLL